MLKAKNTPNNNGRITYSTVAKLNPPLIVERILDTGRATLSRLILPNSSGDNQLRGFYGIEQEWNNNAIGNSCVPEGSYLLNRRETGRYASTYKKRWNHPWVYELRDTEPRSAILIHAVGTSEQLKGCIAPATSISIKDDIISTNGTGRDSYCALFYFLKKNKTDTIIIEDIIQ